MEARLTPPEVTPFFHPASSSISYVVTAPGGSDCVVIDAVGDFDAPAARRSHAFADGIIAHIRNKGLRLAWLLETHAHADRLSASPYIAERLGGRIGIGREIGQVQRTWNEILDLHGPRAFTTASFDRLFADNEEFAVGGLTIRILHTPGHTPADATYVIGDAAFIGDTLFMTDYGTARVDFPGGDARRLYRSIRRILSLPPDTRLFFCHDYLTETRKQHRFEASVAEQRANNIHVHDGIAEDDFAAMRTARDRALSMPTLLLYAVPINLYGGRTPPPDANGTSYLKIPLDRF